MTIFKEQKGPAEITPHHQRVSYICRPARVPAVLNGYGTRRQAKKGGSGSDTESRNMDAYARECLEALATTVPSTHVVITPESLLGLESGETARIPSCLRGGHSEEGVPLVHPPLFP